MKTYKLINKSIEEAIVALQQAVEFAEKASNVRFTEKELLEREARLTLLNTSFARLDRITGEQRRVAIKELKTA